MLKEVFHDVIEISSFAARLKGCLLLFVLNKALLPLSTFRTKKRLDLRLCIQRQKRAVQVISFTESLYSLILCGAI